MRTKSIILLIVLFTAPFLRAQDKTSKTTAVEKLLNISIAKEDVDSMYELVLNEIFRNDNSARLYKDIYHDFLTKHLSVDSLKSIYKELYLQSFDEDEINELIKFYSSEKGKNIIKKESSMFFSARNAMKNRIVANMSEFDEKIAERKKVFEKEEDGNTDYIKVVDPDSSFVIDMPATWIKNDNNSDSNKVISYISKIKTANVSVARMFKKIINYDDYDFNNPEEDLSPLYEPPVTHKEIASQLITDVKEGVPNLNILQNEEMKINGLNSTRLQLLADMNGEKMYFYVTIIECKDRFYSINSAALEETKNKVLPVFERIHNSINVADKYR